MYPNRMIPVIQNITAGRMIEAIKEFRTIFGCGLKEAKDACEAIRAVMHPTQAVNTDSSAEFLVVHKCEHWSDFEVDKYGANKVGALHYAEGIVDDRSEVYVARVVSKAVPKTTRTMKAVA